MGNPALNFLQLVRQVPQVLVELRLRGVGGQKHSSAGFLQRHADCRTDFGNLILRRIAHKVDSARAFRKVQML